MNKILKITVFALVFVLLAVSCNTAPSLQKYIVESKENNQFISIDIPTSILKSKDSTLSIENSEVLKTIKKVNFLALQLNESNKDFFMAESNKVTEILKNPTYKLLAKMNSKERNVSVNYLGEDDAIDEVVVFGTDNKKGFAIVRVLGENMNPAKILKLTQEMNLDGESNQLKQLEGLFKSLN